MGLETITSPSINLEGEEIPIELELIGHGQGILIYIWYIYSIKMGLVYFISSPPNPQDSAIPHKNLASLL